MILGTSQIEITPKPGVELSGFAARDQPSTGALDPLFAKALYLVCDKSELLWIHCDLIGFDRATVRAFRRWAEKELGLKENHVMLSATHTHAGPCTIHLREAGEYDAAYVEFLMARLREVAHAAINHTEKCDLISVEGQLNLAVDRRKTASSHTDPRVAALGFRRGDGTFAAAVVNYAMHPVALGPNNRMISADMSGQAALTLAQQLPGNPVVLVTNGACANLNPPAENVAFAQVQKWGEQIADAVGALLKQAKSPEELRLKITTRVVPLPLDVLDADGINRFADKALLDAEPLAQWGDKYRRVVEHWRATLLKNGRETGNGHHEAELFGVRLNGVILVGANAEVFSEFTDMLRRKSDRKIYLIGYANGDVGYLPTRAAYAEGGYEVEVAHMFYGGFRPKPGGLELLAAAATDLVNELEAGGGVKFDSNAARETHLAAKARASATNA
jgi:neutral ceramidase